MFSKAEIKTEQNISNINGSIHNLKKEEIVNELQKDYVYHKLFLRNRQK